MVLLLVKPKTSHEEVRSLPALQRLKQMDWIGTLLFLAACISLFLALQWGGQTKSWASAEVIGLFVACAILLCLFGASQQFTGERSLLPRRILKQRSALSGTIYLILIGLQMAVVSLQSSLYSQLTKSRSIFNTYRSIFRQFVGHRPSIVAFE